jgi:Alkylmercury lyase
MPQPALEKIMLALLTRMVGRLNAHVERDDSQVDYLRRGERGQTPRFLLVAPCPNEPRQAKRAHRGRRDRTLTAAGRHEAAQLRNSSNRVQNTQWKNATDRHNNLQPRNGDHLATRPRDNVGMDFEDLRLAVYHSFVTTGRPPAIADLCEQLRDDDAAVRAGLRQLAENRHLVLDQQDHVVMAHPFSAVPLGFAVMGARTLWWGGCSWDSFAMPHLLPDDDEVLVSTRCPGCSNPHVWVVGRQSPPKGEQVAHFLVPAARMWDDVVHSCGHQRIFCSNACIDKWLDMTGYERGYVTDLNTLWQLAAHWYDGRLQRGYQRREPSAAADYLRGVGLAGPFWGL